jgi:Rnl2 family RNA ligase
VPLAARGVILGAVSIPHRPYPRIALRADTSGGGGEWVATEKIHGANFVIATDGERVCFGKRKDWLAHDEPFFGWQLLRSRLSAAALRAHAHLGAPRVVRIYGELFGGGYPHPDVTPVPGLAPVQTGIWYAPGLEHAVFDVLVEAEGEVFLGHDELVEVAREAELTMAPLIARGTRAEVFRLAVRRESLVPAALGLPPLASNVAEGVVLKPASSLAPAERPVVKRKIEEFAEARFDEAQAFDPGAFLALPELLVLCEPLVNAARVASARSKVGAGEEAIRQEVVLDVLVDLEAMLPRRFAALHPSELERLQAHVGALTLAAMRR